MSALTFPLEAAAAVLCSPAAAHEEPYCESGLDLAREVVAAFFRAVVACPKCGGTGNASECLRCKEAGQYCGATHDVRCSASHVTLTLFGETIWADPEKVEWRCADWLITVRSESSRPRWEVTSPRWEVTSLYPPCSPNKPHLPDCSWQPRMSAILGNLDSADEIKVSGLGE